MSNLTDLHPAGIAPLHDESGAARLAEQKFKASPCRPFCVVLIALFSFVFGGAITALFVFNFFPPQPPTTQLVASASLSEFFPTKASLLQSKWRDYFEEIYSIDTMEFPFDMRTLTYFKTQSLPEDVAKAVKPYKSLRWWQACEQPPAEERPVLWGELYVQDGTFDPRPLRRSVWPILQANNVLEELPGLQFSLADGFPDNSLVEVMHETGDPDGGMQFMWFYWSKGSGIYLDIGKTKVFQSHREIPTYPSDLGSEQLIAEGYNTIQFVNMDEEHGIRKFEIMLLDDRHHQEKSSTGSACPDPSVSWRFRGGWKGVEPCNCNPLLPKWINCAGRPSVSSALKKPSSHPSEIGVEEQKGLERAEKERKEKCVEEQKIGFRMQEDRKRGQSFLVD
uniref:Uncharacterized protein n=1 Tax=Chromera velia CCMP2878 TaxID=1169474 RepID=A0A0G4F3R6_9ALVE|eukprot:Cvel_14888.t1-p1 / transcript=Cvel_14888.t1 / gene=Cvel_14888 / organism=Chromera_velia_CCMP2878 / gene_product=hypothetical protein / transcript_product=hypothetical protein / location=Cvel_scaffold1077:36142-37899(-) / protein_length=392 / sequence_SO=supercontig / SO=protein_coding / is_pseudo=false